jgi:8-oxo-dGTP pyrophosphatase MutT (NUDIX family)
MPKAVMPKAVITEVSPHVSELRDDRFQPQILQSEIVYDGRIWNVRSDRFELEAPDGKRSQITRDYVDHTGAVAVLVMDDRGRVLLIKQYRHPVRMRDWELPAGLLDFDGESPLAAAKRELAEEVDLVASDWHLLSEFMSSPGGSNEMLRIYLARGLTSTASVFDREEEEAGIELRWVSLEDAVAGVLAHDLQNSILAIAVLSARALRDRDWVGLSEADAPWPRHEVVRAAQ